MNQAGAERVTSRTGGGVRSSSPRLVWLAAALCCAWASSPTRAQPAEPRPVALVGATVHPVAGDLEDGRVATVLVQGGRIRAVGTDLGLGPEVETVDLSGHHLYPGLIDADSALGLTEIGSVAGSVDLREVGRINPNLRAELAVNPDSELLPVARTGGVLLAHVAARSGLVAGTTALIHTDGWTYEDMTVRAPVFLHVRWPDMRLRAHAKESAEEQTRRREEALRAIEETFADAAAYWRARGSAGAEPPAEDVKWEAMKAVVAGDVPVAVSANGLTQLRTALDWAQRAQVRLAVLGGADAWRIADELVLLDVPVVLGPVARLPLRAHEAVDTPYRNAARLHEAGVRIAFSTGGSAFAAANARNLKRHAALAVGHGLPEAAALRALTLGAAEILGVQRRVGSIEPGKDATLVVTDRPLFDARSRVTHAFVAGRPVSLEDRQRRLYEKYRRRPRSQ